MPSYHIPGGKSSRLSLDNLTPEKTGLPFDQAHIEPWVRELPPDEYWRRVIAGGYRAVAAGKKCALCERQALGFDLFRYKPDFAKRIGQREGGAMLCFLCRDCMDSPDINQRIERDLLRRYREYREEEANWEKEAASWAH